MGEARLDWIEHNNLKKELGLKDTAIRSLVIAHKIKVSKVGRKKFYPIAQVNNLIKSNTILN